jgi:hypothetical protein
MAFAYRGRSGERGRLRGRRGCIAALTLQAERFLMGGDRRRLGGLLQPNIADTPRRRQHPLPDLDEPASLSPPGAPACRQGIRASDMRNLSASQHGITESNRPKADWADRVWRRHGTPRFVREPSSKRHGVEYGQRSMAGITLADGRGSPPTQSAGSPWPRSTPPSTRLGGRECRSAAPTSPQARRPRCTPRSFEELHRPSPDPDGAARYFTRLFVRALVVPGAARAPLEAPASSLPARRRGTNS